MSNCLFEAAFENILKTCECAPGFHTMGGVEAMEKFEVCSGEKLTCMNELLNRMGKSDFVCSKFFHIHVQESLIMSTSMANRENVAQLVKIR